MAALILTALLTASSVRLATAGTGLYMGPYFKDPQPLNFTVHKNNVAYLPCEVRQLGDKKVSWVRAKKEDSDILTVGQYTFVNDQRFSVFKSGDTWTLVIKFVQARDSGIYECQISTEPKMALRFRLNVIVPQVEITGEAEKYVRRGSTAKLECRVSSTVELPDYIFWYHAGQRLLEYNQPRMTISVSRASGDKDKSGEMSVTSVLVIHKAHLKDAGNYTCLPSNLPNSTIRLHVLDGEHPAAMQTGSASVPPLLPSSLILAIIITMVVSALGITDTTRRGTEIQDQQTMKKKHNSKEYTKKIASLHMQIQEYITSQQTRGFKGNVCNLKIVAMAEDTSFRNDTLDALKIDKDTTGMFISSQQHNLVQRNSWRYKLSSSNETDSIAKACPRCIGSSHTGAT
ncbi:Immunoglobulin I-set [Trinorchestia longiramus]|nr:Immunoglobulin I-set [Trinorchestia longiramus]